MTTTTHPEVTFKYVSEPVVSTTGHCMVCLRLVDADGCPPCQKAYAELSSTITYSATDTHNV